MAKLHGKCGNNKGNNRGGYKVFNISTVLREDVDFIYNELSEQEKEKIRGANILVTGFAGSLGCTLLYFFAVYGEKLGVKNVFGIDNFMFGKPKWVEDISKCPFFDLRDLDIINCNLDFAKDVNVIFHMASLASPVYYRQHPIETMDADVIGVRRLLDYYKNKTLKGFLFYSSSEIYGDPQCDKIPTDEGYWGNVNTCGPRACYDESKRFGETICYNFARQYNMPITIVRPFNNYGPGMRVNDKRVVADFAKAIIENKDIIIYSDGKPTRTFDYIADATIGYIKCAFYGKFDIFNIGSDSREFSIEELANLYKKVGKDLFGYSGNIVYQVHCDKEYLTDNPRRRCPDIKRAKQLLNFTPKIYVEDGVKRYLLHLNECSVESDE